MANKYGVEKPKQPTAADPYAHRAHRIKYQEGYGAEGAARGKVHIGGDAKGVDPRAESDKHDEAEEAKQEKSYEPADEQ
jgi:hypothetical protein